MKNKIILAFICLITIIAFQNCNKEDFKDASLTENTTKEKITSLGEKYGFITDFKIKKSASNVVKLKSINELEQILKKLNDQGKKGVTLKIKFDKKVGDSYYAKTISKTSLPRLKSGILEVLSNWFYDLTYYNVTIAYDGENPPTVSGFYSGLYLYNYTQTSSQTSVNNGIIKFSTVGTETHEWNVLGVTFHETRTIVTSGTYNILTGEGTINLSGNDYPFH